MLADGVGLHIWHNASILTLPLAYFPVWLLQKQGIWKENKTSKLLSTYKWQQHLFSHSSGPLLTFISRSLSTGCLQMGHLFVWNLKTFAHPLHIHCNVGEERGEKKTKKESRSKKTQGSCVTNKISTGFLKSDYLNNHLNGNSCRSILVY
jgi:hypothetical protein